MRPNLEFERGNLPFLSNYYIVMKNKINLNVIITLSIAYICDCLFVNTLNIFVIYVYPVGIKGFLV